MFKMIHFYNSILTAVIVEPVAAIVYKTIILPI